MANIRTFAGGKKSVVFGLAVVALLAGACSSNGETKYWNANYQYYTFTVATNWTPTGVPGPNDTAAFTNTITGSWSMRWGGNVTNSDVTFSSANSSLRYLDLYGYKWTVTNRFDVAPNAGDSDSLRMSDNTYGSLSVVNVEGTALMTVNHNGLFRIGNNSTCTVDRVVSTNGSSALGVVANSGGLLNILHGSHIASPGYHLTLSRLNIIGGTHLFAPKSGYDWQDSGNVLIDGPSTVVTNTGGLAIGRSVSDTQFVVTNGAKVYMAGIMTLGAYSGHRTKLIVTGAGSTLTNGDTTSIGYDLSTGGKSNEVTVAAGGTLDNSAASFIVGRDASSTDNKVLVTGAGSRLSCKVFYAGSNGSANGTGTVRIENGGALAVGAYLYSGNNGTGAITNEGGVYEFNETIRIVPGTPGNIVLTNGTISFRGTQLGSVATPALTNIAFQGNNAYRLDNATNRSDAYSGKYVFDTGLGASNFCRLEMINGGTRYGSSVASDPLTIGAGGSMLVSNTAATVDLTFTNNGALTIAKSTLTFSKNATLNGVTAIDMGNLASLPVIVAQSNLTLGASSTLALSGTFPAGDVTLFTCAGTLTGQFGSVTGLPSTCMLRYGAGTISVQRVRGAIVTVR